MRNTVRRLAVIAIGGAFVLGVAPAEATELYAATYGSSGWVSPQHAYAYAKDKKADGDPVYSRYGREVGAGETYTLHNKSGNGTTATSGAGAYIYTLRSCVSLDWEPDTCGWSD
ncbi:hypothetical protein [Streptomyces lydicus]|uniref:hypothetical protein n=1 Tax=Streptomyces lydicus TaxID=47763 RepID=UPI002870063E|nr:hypothetical protein [Streptomyces lydicus]